MEIKMLEIGGFGPAVKALRLPHQGIGDSDVVNHAYYGKKINTGDKTEIPAVSTDSLVGIGPKDLHLMSSLVAASDCEAKVMRGIIVWASIKAPIDWWCECETYRAGHERLCSESTMNQEGKKLSGPELREALNKISFGREITKIDYFSYQALRNIWIWRHKHRKDEWRQFCKWIEGLPFAKELILAGLEPKEVSND